MSRYVISVSHDKQESLLEPIAFRSCVSALGKVSVVGEWLVGVGAEDENENPLLIESDFTGLDPESAARLQDAVNALTPDAVANLLRREGSFSSDHWQQVSRVLSGRFPAAVKAKVKSFHLAGDQRVYVAQVGKIIAELKLLRLVKQLHLAIKEDRYGATIRDGIEESDKLLAQAGMSSPARSAGENPASELRSLPDLMAFPELPAPRSGRSNEPTQDEVNDAEALRAVPRTGVKTEAQQKINLVTNLVFRRGLRELMLGLRSAYKTRGPSVLLEARSLRAVLCLTMLADFSKEWRECKRPDCRRIFQIQDKRQRSKEYCSWYCAHLEGTRQKRAKEQTQRQRSKAQVAVTGTNKDDAGAYAKAKQQRQHRKSRKAR